MERTGERIVRNGMKSRERRFDWSGEGEFVREKESSKDKKSGPARMEKRGGKILDGEYRKRDWVEWREEGRRRWRSKGGVEDRFPLSGGWTICQQTSVKSSRGSSKMAPWAVA